VEGWEQPSFHERKKKSYEILSEAFKNHNEVRTTAAVIPEEWEYEHLERYCLS
jgi:hypothetical protein